MFGPGADFLVSSATVHFASLTLKKSSSTTLVHAAGEVVPYSYAVTNTGTVTVDGISLSDDNVDATPSCPHTSLAPGDSMTCTASHMDRAAELTAGSVKNTATVSSTEPDSNLSNNVARATISASGAFVPPATTHVKTPKAPTQKKGQTPSFTG